MKLVVGLGNPGRRYQQTWHNIGFQVLADLAQRLGSEHTKGKFEGEISEARRGLDKVLLLAPHTFMNRSGSSVLAARDFYKLEASDILLVCDDFHLPRGRLRVRPRGSSGGHKGLEDVFRRLGSEAVPRLRIGIGAPPAGWDVADYVLSTIPDREREGVQESVYRASDAVLLWIDQGIQECMNQFNREVPQEP